MSLPGHMRLWLVQSLSFRSMAMQGIETLSWAKVKTSKTSTFRWSVVELSPGKFLTLKVSRPFNSKFVFYEQSLHKHDQINQINRHHKCFQLAPRQLMIVAYTDSLACRPDDTKWPSAAETIPLQVLTTIYSTYLYPGLLHLRS